MEYYIRRLLSFWALALLGLHCSQKNYPEIDVPFETFELENGLRVVVHEDRKAPIVAVNVWYHVGSKDEQAGKTGFAHLFEHLMFGGSENSDQQFIPILESLGATKFNGTTSADRTNYFQNVPTSALDRMLWLESDRMGHFLNAITQQTLDLQRSVVKNERRMRLENQPFGTVLEQLLQNCFPAGHPYSWPVIGSMADLDAATVEDARDWFGRNYGPNNAVLVLAGDIDTKTAKEKVSKYFGAIPPGPPREKLKEWVPRHSSVRRKVIRDRVPHHKIIKAYTVPGVGSAILPHLSLAQHALGGNANSRLNQRLVEKEALASSASASYIALEIAGLFLLGADVLPGKDPSAVEKIMNEELERFLREGITTDELERAKMDELASTVKTLEGVDGFGGKSDLLAEAAVYHGDPAAYKNYFKALRTASREDVNKAVNAWLAGGELVLEYVPFQERSVASEDPAIRRQPPALGDLKAATFPAIQNFKLENGLEVYHVERRNHPIYVASLVVKSGFASDPAGKEGATRLMAALLQKATKNRSALELTADLQRTGSSLAVDAGLDSISLILSGLSTHRTVSLPILADVALNPAFAPADLNREITLLKAAIDKEKSDPDGMALRTLPAFLYGKDHPYGRPLSGSGYPNTVEKLTAADLATQHTERFAPGNAFLVLAGDLTLEDARRLAQKSFGKWEQREVQPLKLAAVAPAANQVLILDRPEAPQTVILASKIIPPRDAATDIAEDFANRILGGNFDSRINQNLRENKGWAYGAWSYVANTQGQRLFFAGAPVQSDKTFESVQEIKRELEAIAAGRPVTSIEMEKVRTAELLSLAGTWETTPSIAGSVVSLARRKYPLDYYSTYAQKVQGLTLGQVSQSARTFDAQNVVWVLVGDRKLLEPRARAAGLGLVRIIDADGNEVR
ncbi:MAG: insulinase family protein [Spirochaetales bacterium]|nr:insulinase family protein [Spirochaetales bacterium]